MQKLWKEKRNPQLRYLITVNVLICIVATTIAACCFPLACLRIAYTADTPEFDRPCLFLCTHDYEHIDLFTMRSEAQKWSMHNGLTTQFVVADRFHNHMFCSLVHRHGGCIPVRGDTVRKCVAALDHEHVCVFLYRDTSGTGTYHISRNTCAPVILVRIHSDAPPSTLQAGYSVLQCVRNSVGSRVHVTYTPLTVSPTEPPQFMQRLLDAMYSKEGGSSAALSL